MPRKSRRGRGKSPARNKRRQFAPAAQQPAAVQPTAATPIPSVGVPPMAAQPGSNHYAYVITELKRIGTLSGIALVIMIILVLILS